MPLFKAETRSQLWCMRRPRSALGSGGKRAAEAYCLCRRIATDLPSPRPRSAAGRRRSRNRRLRRNGRRPPARGSRLSPPPRRRGDLAEEPVAPPFGAQLPRAIFQTFRMYTAFDPARSVSFQRYVLSGRRCQSKRRQNTTETLVDKRASKGTLPRLTPLSTTPSLSREGPVYRGLVPREAHAPQNPQNQLRRVARRRLHRLAPGSTPRLAPSQREAGESTSNKNGPSEPKLRDV